MYMHVYVCTYVIMWVCTYVNVLVYLCIIMYSCTCTQSVFACIATILHLAAFFVICRPKFPVGNIITVDIVCVSVMASLSFYA